MWKSERKEAGAMEREDAGRRAARRIILILAAGALLTAADIFLSRAGQGADMLREDGRLYMIRPDEGEERSYISFRAQIRGKGESFEKNVDVALDPYTEETEEKEAADGKEEKEASAAEMAEAELRAVTGGFNENTDSRKVLLPEETEGGWKITWREENQSSAPIIGGGAIILAALVYRGRFASLEKRKRLERESVIRQLPEFVNRLVLLLNAGLVLNSAFEKAAGENKYPEREDSDYFYSRLRDIYISSKTANGSMYGEFKRFARESGVKELMRISNILGDNISKGVNLTEKLERESELLWINRKKSCEERGRLAETKLTLPLMIFLIVLMIITIAPALMEL